MKLKYLFVPAKKNNFTPVLLSRRALLVYAVVVLFFNFILVQFRPTLQSASITQDSLLQMHNYERAKNGLNTLRINQKLNESATEKAIAMLQTNCWSHYCPNGQSPWEFFDDAGYLYFHAGENLAEGFSTTESVINAWMNSPTHRANMLNDNFTEVGFGFANGSFQGNPNNTIIVVHFGKPLDENLVLAASTSDLDAEAQVEITNPENGSSVNANDVLIEGTVIPSDSTVVLEVDGKRAGRVNAAGENYTFRTRLEDGLYGLQTKSLQLNSEDILEESEIVSVEVDTVPPEYFENTLRVDETESEYNILMQLSDDVQQLETNVPNTVLSSRETGYWKGALPKSRVENVAEITFTATDEASNEFTFLITLEQIQSAAAIEDEISGEEVHKIFSSSIFTSFFERLADSNIRSLFAIGFTVYLLILFGIDFYILKKTDMIERINRKPHIYASIFGILLILLNLGGAAGNILTGFTT